MSFDLVNGCECDVMLLKLCLHILIMFCLLKMSIPGCHIIENLNKISLVVVLLLFTCYDISFYLWKGSSEINCYSYSGLPQSAEYSAILDYQDCHLSWQDCR